MDEEYTEAVLALVEQIPPGRVMSYGVIAEVVGESLHRGGPRLVARVLATQGGGVPWWRVVTAGGRLPPGHEVRARREPKPGLGTTGHLEADRNRALASADRVTIGGSYRPVPLVVFQLAYEFTQVNKGSLSDVTTYLDTSYDKAHALLVGAAFGF